MVSSPEEIDAGALRQIIVGGGGGGDSSAASRRGAAWISRPTLIWLHLQAILNTNLFEKVDTIASLVISRDLDYTMWFAVRCHLLE